MPDDPFISHAPNREDVVLWRALGHVDQGHYLELRSGPEQGRAVAALAERGWTGTFATGADLIGPEEHLDQTGAPLHLLVVGPSDDARGVLARLEEVTGLPWVVVVDARPDEDPVEPTDAEGPLARAGYTCTLRDGVSRFYVSPEHPELMAALRVPAHARDEFVDATWLDLQEQIRYWRGRAVASWSVWEPAPATYLPPETQRALLEAKAAEVHAQNELAQIQTTLSWRATRPLRALRQRWGGR